MHICVVCVGKCVCGKVCVWESVCGKVCVWESVCVGKCVWESVCVGKCVWESVCGKVCVSVRLCWYDDRQIYMNKALSLFVTAICRVKSYIYRPCRKQ
jgi:hypothetical protein